MNTYSYLSLDPGENENNKHPSRQCCVCTVHKNRTMTLHLQVLCNATSQRGLFPEISHSQALLGALVSVLQKF
jgi:hypothetical protein